MRIAKTGKPYFYCGNCQTRAFINNTNAFIGLRYLAPGVEAIIRGLNLTEDQASRERGAQAEYEQVTAAARS